ncbi:hypothetical protein ABIA32_003066 [Streptacidiphilus sp. MAP12-20]|uniref:hypothetical protein n=1 Tax=Streptacidiphilus sp. MAP12-20 TaxID=3156299 RepID=UPI0035160076
MRHVGGAGGDHGGFESPEDMWRQSVQADLNTLGRGRFPVYAPTAPLLPAPALTEWQLTNGSLAKVVLCHGDPFAVGGPWLLVVTAEAQAHATEMEYGLGELVEDERDRLFTHAGIDESGPVGPVAEGEILIPVDGVPVAGLLRREGPLWAARLRPETGGVVLTVTGRGVEPDRVALRAVDDLAPYAHGRQQLLSALLLRRRRREGEPGAGRPEPTGSAEQALGLTAHRQLIEFCVASALRTESAVREHRVPRTPRSEMGRWGELWESAVRQQMKLAGEDHEEANEAVTAMINQMTSLASAVDWFPDSLAGRAAVEESIRYTAFESEVSSLAAQRAWRADWYQFHAPKTGRPRSPEEARLLHELRRQGRDTWLDLWRAWHAGR